MLFRRVDMKASEFFTASDAELSAEQARAAKRQMTAAPCRNDWTLLLGPGHQCRLKEYEATDKVQRLQQQHGAVYMNLDQSTNLLVASANMPCLLRSGASVLDMFGGRRAKGLAPPVASPPAAAASSSVGHGIYCDLNSAPYSLARRQQMRRLLSSGSLPRTCRVDSNSSANVLCHICYVAGAGPCCMLHA